MGSLRRKRDPLEYENAVDKGLQEAISGAGAPGPNGERYQIYWSGLIDQSNYALEKNGFYFPFPKRHTLPTRIIVPDASITSCYACHRLIAPMPPDDPQVKTPVHLPPSQAVEEDLEMVRLTQDSGIDINGVWSPDGNWIAWSSDRSGRFQIWVMRKDGSEKQQITGGESIHGWPMWSPDGKRLVFWGWNEKKAMSSISIYSLWDGKQIKVVESEERLDRPAWRPDGEYIAYAAQNSGNWDIWVTASKMVHGGIK